MPTSNIEALDRMIELINSGWTTRSNARDIHNFYISPISTLATCWCMNGALLKAFGLDNMESGDPNSREMALSLKDELCDDLPAYSRSFGITSFNDHVAVRKEDVILQIQKTRKRLAAT